ncbi:UDP-N-acetylmuramoyl-L-alanine--D-glutamate ligase [Clostridiaceae bacterium 68-1-5]|uniref:UDP-N-acetylmuramoylalanine--D-glutamate ligase n=1 Tax=Suipraeoptans intestinalis TaxID=2606628 RepID=A0A6N7UTE9_9FIRM|nr:UDP-N-acetylmuramoyl-L-alanine--D-glutamate ligase [Suipraeoptans intestinalis]MSR94498.1 UDP-N-acetylmuramoyl-L-alanine--D-glutamate ligase [Suipraeoptans intestinalis]
MKFTGKKALVFGTGLSGIAAADLLSENQIKVVLYDEKQVEEEKLLERLKHRELVQIYSGKLPKEVKDGIDSVILSPGVPLDSPLVEELKASGKSILGEVELAYRFAKGDVLAITGTNGKTTTTALLGEIMKGFQREVFVVGNIGNPYTSVAEQMTENSVTVAEVSSFQLETIETFRPRVSAILNVTPDHLNRHHTMEAYWEAKAAITRNQRAEDTCILNYEDPYTRNLAEKIPARVVFFSSRRVLEDGIYLKDGKIFVGQEAFCDTKDLQILGTHNYENVMAAVGMAIAYGVPKETVKKAVLAFGGVEHRIEYVAEKHKVAYYNDSKGTNPDAAIKGIQAMNRPTVLIGGGYDKDSHYKEWIESFQGKVRKLVLVGDTKEKIAKEAEACGFFEYVFADTFQEAVALAADLAQEGDAVLLSPACASWDMFPNYEARGETFKELVRAL